MTSCTYWLCGFVSLNGLVACRGIMLNQFPQGNPVHIKDVSRIYFRNGSEGRNLLYIYKQNFISILLPMFSKSWKNMQPPPPAVPSPGPVYSPMARLIFTLYLSLNEKKTFTFLVTRQKKRYIFIVNPLWPIWH